MVERWRNRIIEHGDEHPDQLLANPQNWRIHPQHQQDALAGVLDEVGVVQEVLVNRRTGHVVDGHLRVGLAISRGEPTVPVTYIDVSEAEERLILATFDPLGALAGTDREVLAELLDGVETDSEAVRELLDGVDDSVPEPVAGNTDPDDVPEGAPLDGLITCPECGHEFARREGV